MNWASRTRNWLGPRPQAAGRVPPSGKSISISVHFVRANPEAPHEIRDTILHEIAHALAWTRHGERTHGARWKQIRREIGAVPCAAAKPDAIRVTTYKYLLRLKTTGEVVGKYHRRPAFAKHLKRMALKGRPDTLGQLELIPSEKTGYVIIIKAHLLHSSSGSSGSCTGIRMWPLFDHTILTVADGSHKIELEW